MYMWYKETTDSIEHMPAGTIVAVQNVSWFSCFVPPGPRESSLPSLLDVSQQLMLILIQSILLILEWIHFGKTETHTHWFPFQSGTRLFSWSDCWWHRSSLLMDQGRSCTKTFLGSITVPLMWVHWQSCHRTHLFCYYRNDCQTVVSAPLFLRCVVRGRKQLAEVWLCWRHWLSVHAER